MSAQVEHLAVGIIIRGCPDPEGSTLIAPVLWINRDVQAISNPINGLVGCNIRQRIKASEDGVDGFVHQVSLQDLLSSGGQVKVKLRDKPKTSTRRDLGQLFQVDSAQYVTNVWAVNPLGSYLSKTQTIFNLHGEIQPNVNDIIWVGAEAMQITSAAPALSGDGVTVVQVTRGVLGSRARRHVVKPSNYPGNSNGSDFCITALSRPDFDKFNFEVEMYLFSVDGNTATRVEFWPRMTEGRPTPEGDDGQGQEWSVNTVDVMGWLSRRKTKKRGAVKLSHAVQIRAFGNPATLEVPPAVTDGYGPTVPNNFPPVAVDLWLTPYEAEKFFDVRFRQFFSEAVDSNAVSELNLALTAYPTEATRKINGDFTLKVGGYTWLYRVVELTYVSSGPVWNVDLNRQFIQVHCSLVAYVQEDGKQAGCKDNPCPGYPEKRQGYITVPLTAFGNFYAGSSYLGPGTVIPAASLILPRRTTLLNQGWSLMEADPIRSSLGEEAPEAKFRFSVEKVKPVELLLMLLLSGNGGGENSTDYDLIPTQVCPEVDPSFLNLGSASVTPITNNSRTSELLKLNQLLVNLETVPIDVEKFDLGAALRRLLRANSLITSYVAEGITFRQISGFFNTAPTSLPQVSGVGRLVKNGEQRLPAMKSLSVIGGHHPITLKPGWEQPIYLFDGGDIDEGERLEVFPVGGSLTPDQWISGPFAQLIRVTFLMQRGSPNIYKVPTKRQRGSLYVGDLVSWSAPGIIGPNGRGAQVTRFNRWLVIGRDVNTFNGDQHVFLMEDTIGNLLTYDGDVAPAFLIDRISDNEGSGLWSFVLKGLMVTGQADPRDVLTSLWENVGYVRIICEDVHNPGNSTGNASRAGYLEAYGVVSGSAPQQWDSTGPDNYYTIDVAIDPAWATAGFDPALFVEGRTWLVMCDHRPASVNPEGNEIGPVDAYQNANAAMIAPGDGISGVKPWGGSLSVFDV